MFGWSMRANAWRSASKRATTWRVSMPEFDNLKRDAAFDRLLLLGHIDHAKSAFSDLFQQLVTAQGLTDTFIGDRSRLNGGSVSGAHGMRCIRWRIPVVIFLRPAKWQPVEGLLPPI